MMLSMKVVIVAMMLAMAGVASVVTYTITVSIDNSRAIQEQEAKNRNFVEHFGKYEMDPPHTGY